MKKKVKKTRTLKEFLRDSLETFSIEFEKYVEEVDPDYAENKALYETLVKKFFKKGR